jgi:TldD protein
VNIEEKIRNLVKRKDVDYLEVRIEDGSETSISINRKKIESVSNGRISGGNARVLVSGIWGFVYFNDVNELKEKIESAISQAKTLKGTVKEIVTLAPVNPVEVVEVIEVKNDPESISLKDKVDLLKHYSDIALSTDNKIVNVLVVYDEKKKILHYANSESTYVKKEVRDLGGWIIPTSSDGKEIQRTHVSFGSNSDFSVVEDLDNDIREKSILAVKLLDADDPKGGEFPVIIDCFLGGIFIHEAFGHLSEADFFSENPRMREIMKIGNVFGPKILNVFDTGGMEGHRRTLHYDDLVSGAELSFF